MRILLLCHSFNSLSQRLFAELKTRGHLVSVELDISDAVTREACELFKPDLVLAPFLKRRIPQEVWGSHLCLIVHPGPPGDRGPAALDWAILGQQRKWGVTVLQADEEFDAGPVWASAAFPMREIDKGTIYRGEVTTAALAAVLQAVERLSAGHPRPAKAPFAAQFQPAMPQSDRRIDWEHHTTAEVLTRIRSADGQPGVKDEWFGHGCHLFDAHAASGASLQRLEGVAPGSAVARRDEAILRRTVDGGVWIGQVRLPRACGDGPGFKLPAALAFAPEGAQLPEWTAPPANGGEQDEWAELRYRELGPAGARVGCLSFDFYNGAMSTRQCERLLAALREAKLRPTRVLLLLGGSAFFSNGIHLNCIEAAAHRAGDSAADESWRNINAMNDVAREIIECTDRLTISVLRGNAGAGGAFLALAADEVWARAGVMLNPHYKNMGNLYGSEYWTYLLPRRVGEERAQALMAQRLPLLADEARSAGLVDLCLDGDAESFEHQAIERALKLAGAYNFPERVLGKQHSRAIDEAKRPLAEYRKQELARMHRNFYGFDPSYHVARYHFVHKLPHAWTPRHLAAHRP
jgi:putative two-component system protein, hydrogenase maturation factor HypX/HoxX